MCGGGGGSDAAAQASQQQMEFLTSQQAKADAKEAQRQADITSGTNKINEAYSGFTPDYYAKIASDYFGGYAKPQIDVAQQRDLRQSKFGFARNGTSNSSAAAREIGDIQSIYGQAATDAANRGQQMSQDRQTQVANSRTNALQQLQSSEQPLSTAANAVQTSQAYTVSPAAMAITDLITNAANAVNRSYMTSGYTGGGSGGGGFFGNSKSTAGGAGTTKTVK